MSQYFMSSQGWIDDLSYKYVRPYRTSSGIICSLFVKAIVVAYIVTFIMYLLTDQGVHFIKYNYREQTQTTPIEVKETRTLVFHVISKLNEESSPLSAIGVALTDIDLTPYLDIQYSELTINKDATTATDREQRKFYTHRQCNANDFAFS